MTFRRTLRSTLALLILSTAALAQTPDVGQKAPDFTLSTPEGASISLASLRAKGTVVVVLLRGYPGYQCPYCVKQVHDFVENADKFAAAKATVLLVYPGPPADLDAKAKEFVASQSALPANIQLVVDPDYKMTNQYGLRWEAPHETAYASTFLLDRKGTVLFEHISHTHSDRTSAADILAELQKHQ